MTDTTSGTVDLSPLDTTIVLTDPLSLKLQAAQGMTKPGTGRAGYISAGNLSDAISDIVFTLSVQGASYLVVTVSDPWWKLLSPAPGKQDAFIDLDANGFLQPISIEFPQGSGKMWYLCSCNPTSDLTGANVKLTFEDETVQTLRYIDKNDGGPFASNSSETRIDFINRLLKFAKITPHEWFSNVSGASVKAFEAPAGPSPSAEIKQWQDWFNAQQQQKQQEAAATAQAVQGVGSAVQQSVSGVVNAIGSLLDPPTGKTGTTTQTNWWVQNVQNPNGPSYIPNG